MNSFLTWFFVPSLHLYAVCSLQFAVCIFFWPVKNYTEAVNSLATGLRLFQASVLLFSDMHLGDLHSKA